MALLSISNDTLLLGIGVKLLFVQYKPDDGTKITHWTHEIENAAPISASKVKKYLPMNEDDSKDDQTEENLNTEVQGFKLNNASVSVCGKLLAITMTDKTLYLYELRAKEVHLLSRRRVARNTSVVRFFPDSSNLIVADKTGDLFLFDCLKPEEPGSWILGHMSQVLGLGMNRAQTRIASCDRDEKIKISKWPESYDIETFCLGHTEFISAVEFFHFEQQELLLSGSGDGLLKIWDYQTSKCLYTIHLDSPVGAVYVNESESKDLVRVVVLLRRPDQVVMLTLNHVDLETGGRFCHKILYKTTFPEGSFVCCATLERNMQNFWTIFQQKDAGLCIKRVDINLCENEVVKDIEKLLRQEFDSGDLKFEDVLENLYKKKFDNISEYQEKKRRRIEEEKARKHKATQD